MDSDPPMHLLSSFIFLFFRLLPSRCHVPLPLNLFFYLPAIEKPLSPDELQDRDLKWIVTTPVFFSNRPPHSFFVLPSILWSGVHFPGKKTFVLGKSSFDSSLLFHFCTPLRAFPSFLNFGDRLLLIWSSFLFEPPSHISSIHFKYSFFPLQW